MKAINKLMMISIGSRGIYMYSHDIFSILRTRSPAKRSAISASVTGPRRLPLETDDPCHSRCGTLKNPHMTALWPRVPSIKFEAVHIPYE